MPTAIYTDQVTDSMAWTGADFSSKEDFCFDLSSRNVAALESILARTAHKKRDDITGDDVHHPDLSLIHISEPTRRLRGSRMPSSA